MWCGITFHNFEPRTLKDLSPINRLLLMTNVDLLLGEHRASGSINWESLAFDFILITKTRVHELGVFLKSEQRNLNP